MMAVAHWWLTLLPLRLQLQIARKSSLTLADDETDTDTDEGSQSIHSADSITPSSAIKRAH
jgi:hypothetical protein